MKQGIHPKWYPEAKVTCACGVNFTVGATIPEIHVEVCASCHPFYSGVGKYIDTMGRVERFQARQKAVKPTGKKGKFEQVEEEAEYPKSLKEIMAELKTQDIK